MERPDDTPGASEVESKGHAESRTKESDPVTGYGLAWRIVRIATESDAKLIRVSALLLLLCVLLWFITNIGRLGEVFEIYGSVLSQ